LRAGGAAIAALLAVSIASCSKVGARPIAGLAAWRVSLYPDAHRFAFTIVHDADSAYSARLAPLFEEFDALKMKITATIFVYWAGDSQGDLSWSRWNAIADPRVAFLAPSAVPLVDQREREFYVDLAARGHEIAMHTPSDTSDTTEELENSFEYFAQIFGHPPTVYVEHSSRSNRETLEHDGSNPQSPYYSKGVLSRYAPWVWVDGPLGIPPANETRYFDLAAFQGAPFSDSLAKRYGLPKVFTRTGKWRDANGDGFLDWYSKANIDTLERDRGLALVYTHLDERWLDADTRKMREPLRERLEYLTARNGWFVPAGTILDRISVMKNVSLSRVGNQLRIENRNAVPVASVTLISPDGTGLCSAARVFHPLPSGDIVVGLMRPSEVMAFDLCR